MKNNLAKRPKAKPEILSADNMSGRSSADLRAALAEAISATAHGLARAATIWTELNRRGEAPSGLRSGLATWLPRIARGELAAEAVIAFAGQRFLLISMVGMDLDEQRRYAAGAEIAVAVIDDKGRIVREDKPLARLNNREILLAVEGGQIRPFTTQMQSLNRSTAKTATKTHSPYSTATIKTSGAFLCIGRSRIFPTDLTDALQQLGFSLTRFEK